MLDPRVVPRRSRPRKCVLACEAGRNRGVNVAHERRSSAHPPPWLTPFAIRGGGEKKRARGHCRGFEARTGFPGCRRVPRAVVGSGGRVLTPTAAGGFTEMVADVPAGRRCNGCWRPLLRPIASYSGIQAALALAAVSAAAVSDSTAASTAAGVFGRACCLCVAAAGGAACEAAVPAAGCVWIPATPESGISAPTNVRLGGRCSIPAPVAGNKPPRLCSRGRPAYLLLVAAIWLPVYRCSGRASMFVELLLHGRVHCRERSRRYSRFGRLRLLVVTAGCGTQCTATVTVLTMVTVVAIAVHLAAATAQACLSSAQRSVYSKHHRRDMCSQRLLRRPLQCVV